jgi:glutathione peroxidase
MRGDHSGFPAAPVLRQVGRWVLAFAVLVSGAIAHADAPRSCADGLLDTEVRRLATDEQVNLCESYADKVLLVVNTASRCGNTPQYEGLEALYESYRDRGFAVLGFPSNDFAGQEPGTEDDIREFCRTTYDIRFPMFEKTVVKGPQAAPLFKALTKAATAPQWNFHKYLIAADGTLLEAFSPGTQPQDPALTAAIDQALQAKAP